MHYEYIIQYTTLLLQQLAARYVSDAKSVHNAHRETIEVFSTGSFDLLTIELITV